MVSTRTLSILVGPRSWLRLLLSALLLGACSGADPSSASTLDAGAAVRRPVDADTLLFQWELRRWRAERQRALTRVDGWTSLVGLHWITPGPHHIGSAGGNGIRLAVGPRQMGRLDLERDGRLYLLPERSSGLTLNGAPLARRARIHSDADPQGPDLIGFDTGKGRAGVIVRGGRLALRVWHADAPTRTGFVGLHHWPADLHWRVEGHFQPHPPGKRLPIVNALGIVEAILNPGVVQFRRNGRSHRLEALAGEAGRLFFVFADRSNGHGSYGAGRYLEASMADAEGRVILDFNRAYNPPCAFTLYATCPLPPLENRLALRVEAGEKAYAKPLDVR